MLCDSRDRAAGAVPILRAEVHLPSERNTYGQHRVSVASCTSESDLLNWSGALAGGSSAEDPSSQREMAGALQSSPLRPYRVFEHICTTTQHAPADGSVCMLGGAPIEVGAPCAGTSNVDDRARIKCDRRLFGAVQVTHQPPSSAADFVGAAREDIQVQVIKIIAKGSALS